MPLSDPNFPEWLNRILSGTGGAVMSSFLARLMWHTRLVQLGKRHFWSIHLLWEIPTAFSMSIIGAGLADWIGLASNSNATLAVISTLAYLGPRAIEEVFNKTVDRVSSAIGTQVGGAKTNTKEGAGS